MRRESRLPPVSRLEQKRRSSFLCYATCMLRRSGAEISVMTRTYPSPGVRQVRANKQMPDKRSTASTYLVGCTQSADEIHLLG